MERLERVHYDTGVEVTLAFEHLPNRLRGVTDTFHQFVTLVDRVIAGEKR